jgi:hypothetical protein
LFRKEKRMAELIDKLKIIARCDCGKYPKVLLGFSFGDDVKKN